jgi:hypothetical protein
MITFKYDESGNLLTYKNGKKIGKIITMGDDLKSESQMENQTEGKVQNNA